MVSIGRSRTRAPSSLSRSSARSLASSHDPLSHLTAPPANESTPDKEKRIQGEQLAKKKSEEIDKWLKAESSSKRKEQAGEVHLALLGQSNAGKTTLLKQVSRHDFTAGCML